MSLTRLGAQIVEEGTRQEVPVEDDNNMMLLSQMLKQLKIFNLHMSVMTDNDFNQQDVD